MGKLHYFPKYSLENGKSEMQICMFNYFSFSHDPKVLLQGRFPRNLQLVGQIFTPITVSRKFARSFDPSGEEMLPGETTRKYRIPLEVHLPKL